MSFGPKTRYRRLGKNYMPKPRGDCPACGEKAVVIPGSMVCTVCFGDGKDSQAYRQKMREVVPAPMPPTQHDRMFVKVEPTEEKEIENALHVTVADETVAPGTRCPTCGYTPPKSSTERVKAWRERNA